MRLADPPENPNASDPIPFDPDAGRPQFPVFILAAPGLLCMLALALPGALANTTRSAGAHWAATLAAAAGAILCFAIVAARSREREVRIPAIAMVIVAVLLTLRAVLRLL